jgi:hypothetical protein
MRALTLALVCCSLLSAGCTTAQIKQRPFEQVLADYRSIQKGMTEEVVIARLGTPDSVDAAGNLHWRQEQYSGNFVTLVVTLDDNRQVLRTGVGSRSDTAADYPAIPNRPNRNDGAVR